MATSAVRESEDEEARLALERTVAMMERVCVVAVVDGEQGNTLKWKLCRHVACRSVVAPSPQVPQVQVRFYFTVYRGITLTVENPAIYINTKIQIELVHE